MDSKIGWSYVNIQHAPVDSEDKGHVWVSAVETDYTVEGFGPYRPPINLPSSLDRALKSCAELAQQWGYRNDDANS